MVKVKDAVFEGAEDLQAASDVASICAATERFALALGFRHLTCATVRQLRDVFLHETIFQTWPKTAVQPFHDKNLFARDPIIARSRYESDAFFWTVDAYDPSDAAHASILEIRRSASVTGGCCAPIPERVGGHTAGRLVLYLTGSDFPRTNEVRIAVRLIAAQVAARIACLSDSEGRVPEGEMRFFETTGLLSERERIILSWVASGKSSWAIAKILQISEHTVNQHIEKASHKLEAANRTEAVVKAMVMDSLWLDPKR
jgi:LuxR family quorum sensing-dependent transcriptional regulator